MLMNPLFITYLNDKQLFMCEMNIIYWHVIVEKILVIKIILKID